MRPSLSRRVIPCIALLSPACGDSGSHDPDPGSHHTQPKTGSDPITASDSAPPSITLPPPDASDTTDTTDGSSGDPDDTTTGPFALCSPPEVKVDDVAANAACDVPLQLGGFDPVVEWKWGDSTFCGPAVVGQTIDSNGSGAIDRDDLPLVFLYQHGDAIALWGDGSGVAWHTPGSFGSDGGLALGDLDGDGWSELVTASKSTICALDARDGAEKWCTADLGDSMDPNGYNYPSIADMDGDGDAEVIIGPAILDSTGAVIGKGQPGQGATPWFGDPNVAYGSVSAVVDLDGDGVQEVVTGSAAYDLDGNTVWENGGLDGFVAVADFDLDGAGELVKTSGAQIFGMESDGTEVWGPLEFPGNLGPPAIDDLDGDGSPEIVVGAQAQLVALHWGGETMWTAEIADLSGSAGPVLFDFEGDGFPEVLYADEVAIRFFSGVDGAPKFLSTEHASYTIFETPIVVDVDGDDQVEIVLGHCTADAALGAITIYGDADESWPPGRKIWNQHTYHVTNIGDLGGVPGAYASNWLAGNTFNSFRSGDIGQPPGEFHDLQAEILGVCEEDCARGTATLTARIRNAGTREAPAGLPVTVRAGADGKVAATLTTLAPVPAGKTGELLIFTLDAADLADARPSITVDDAGAGEGKLFECDEHNNTVAWPTPVCADP